MFETIVIEKPRLKQTFMVTAGSDYDDDHDDATCGQGSWR
jgi:hypothetical protein